MHPIESNIILQQDNSSCQILKLLIS